MRLHPKPCHLSSATLSCAAVAAVISLTVPRATAWVPRMLAQATPATGSSDNPGTTDTLRPAERTFIVQGVEDGRRQAELSRLAVSQAASSSVRDLAQQLVGDYREINNSLETLARRKSVSLPLQPTSFSDRYRDLSGQTGATFDRAFVRELVAANQRVLRLCEFAVANARDSDVRNLAGNLLPVIRDHVNKASQLEQQL